RKSKRPKCRKPAISGFPNQLFYAGNKRLFFRRFPRKLPALLPVPEVLLQCGWPCLFRRKFSANLLFFRTDSQCKLYPEPLQSGSLVYRNSSSIKGAFTESQTDGNLDFMFVVFLPQTLIFYKNARGKALTSAFMLLIIAEKRN